MIIVRPGGRIAVDGVVVAGASSVNQAPITGESMPVEKFKGSEVFSGTLNETGRLEIKTTKAGNDTTLSRIVHLVEQAQGTKAPIQTIADRFTVWFLPTVLVLAAIGFLTSGDVKVAVSVLLVACPCAFAIATPTAVTAGISNMARRAVLIKGGVFLELARKIDTLVMDKTGTFTFGRPKVVDVIAFDGQLENDVLQMAAIAEKYSEHSLASSVMTLAKERGIETADVTLMNDDLSRVVEFMEMSKKVLLRIKRNIFFSIIYNVVGLALASFGMLTPVLAVIFQEAGCVTVVFF